MTRSLADIQRELPRSVPLYRYLPQRRFFRWRGWDPSTVRGVSDLPPYLILGNLDPYSFELSRDGWSARWQGTEADTHIDVAYTAQGQRWEVRQTWCGLDGGFSTYPARIPLEQVIGESLYLKFPPLWDSEAKSGIEAAYQLTVIQEPEGALTFFGNPDGAFRTVLFPVAVRNLRIIREWIKHIAEESALSYPLSVEAKRITQAINYVEGKAPGWTTEKVVLFRQSLLETGLVPFGLPHREEAEDGSAAWTLGRDIYFVFVTLPFAGLTDFLKRMASDYGPIRLNAERALRFTFQPLVIPGFLENQADKVVSWDRGETIRCIVYFETEGSDQAESVAQEGVYAEASVLATLDRVESVSAMLCEEMELILCPNTTSGAGLATQNRAGNSQ
jgi:hypothetical protein